MVLVATLSQSIEGGARSVGRREEDLNDAFDFDRIAFDRGAFGGKI
jgi:hypothetical protein